jgi:beta-galactosidase/beta-glucuronidase
MTTTLPSTPDRAAAHTPGSVPRPEYPRPHFDRSHSWRTLNGRWEFRRGDDAAPGRVELITVPFAWETPASGVEAHWLERAEYRRTFTVPGQWSGQRVVLHFGAVHHEATVRVDGAEVGTHRGGYVPFEFDITDALDGADDHELVIAVTAPNDKRAIAHGKQRSMPRDDYDSCAFTPSSGIWQPVWLEARPATYLRELTLRPTPDLDGIVITGLVAGPGAPGARVHLSVREEPGIAGVPAASGPASHADPGTDPVPAVAEAETTAAALADGVRLTVAAPRRWSPATPDLYRVSVAVESADGTDHVESTTGLRTIETCAGAVYLNGARISLRGVLDQGYWPATGITAPDDAAFVRDLEIACDAGFTMVRKHLKLEDPRFHHHADRMGMLVWAEPASTGRFSAAAVQAFEDQIEPMVRRDGNHPSIIVWGLYNEEWGLDWAVPDDPAKQEAVRSARALLRGLDATRPAVDNSGWAHLDTDLVDWHVYDEHPAGWARKVAGLVAGDTSFPVATAVGTIVQKRLMAAGPVPRGVPFLNSEFGGGWTSVDRGWNLHWQTQELRRHDSVAGWVWTELNDIEHESAGVVAADRAVKDHGGRLPAHANGETAVVFDVVPEAPGRDVVTATGAVEFGVHVSHHGSSPVDVQLWAAWGKVFGEDPGSAPEQIGAVTAEPFRLSDAVAVRAELPADAASRRLHVLLRSGGSLVGRGAVDVVRG